MAPLWVLYAGSIRPNQGGDIGPASLGGASAIRSMAIAAGPFGSPKMQGKSGQIASPRPLPALTRVAGLQFLLADGLFGSL